MASKKNKTKKVDKTFIAIVCICAGLTALIVGAIVLPEPIIAAVKLNNAKQFFADDVVEKVVINDPMHEEALLNNYEKVLSDDEAEVFAERLASVLKNVKYSDIYSANYGVWKKRIVSYNSTDENKIYVDEEAIYIENRGKLIKYSVSEDYRAEYDEFYSDITEILD